MTSSLLESLVEEDHGEGIIFILSRYLRVGLSRINSIVGG